MSYKIQEKDIFWDEWFGEWCTITFLRSMDMWVLDYNDKLLIADAHPKKGMIMANPLSDTSIYFDQCESIEQI